MVPKDDGFDDVETLARPRRPDGANAAPRYRATVVKGVDSGSTLLLDGLEPGRVLVGQGPACALVLHDRLVSRRHLSLQISDTGVHVCDLGSTNGTFVGSVRVREAWLRGGELVSLGDTVLAFEQLEPGPPPPLAPNGRFGKLVGNSIAMRRLYPFCERLAQSHVPLVIEGETGTGKEVLAESIHEASPRAQGPFVVFDCTTVAPNLLEAALFGHDRGAFTGAVDSRPGVFEEAHGGTLFIDEIGDLDIALQAKLLRALERGEIRRVGGKAWLNVDVRIIAATRRDLDAAVQAGRFRDDLFFRLAVTRVELPPLRQRAGDVHLLVDHFWRLLGGSPGELAEEQIARFEAYDWPGNVRELMNAVARLIALGDLAPFSTPPSIPPSDGSGPSSRNFTALGAGSHSRASDAFEEVLALGLPLPRARQLVVDAFERRYVERVLAEHGGNVRRAAAASGLARRYFQVLRARLK